MKFQITTLFTLLLFSSYSQNSQKAVIGKKILGADSIVIINNLEPESETVIDSLLKNFDFKNDIFKSQKKLTASKKKELGSIFVNPSGYSGRFASRSGFGTGQVILIWKGASFSFIKVSLYTHDLFSSTNPTEEYISIDPRVVDKLEKLYNEIGLVSRK